VIDQFEWNEGKAHANRVKHRVSFEEATTIFADPHSRTMFDPGHSDDEDRFVTMGVSDFGRLMGAQVVMHTDRGSAIRIVSEPRPPRAEDI
jgi:uncharacterized protein